LVEHPKVIEAFNRGLSPTDDGRFRLDFGNDWCFVTVEDAAYRVLLIDVDESKGVFLRLSDRQGERLDPDTLFLDEEGVFCCRVKEGRAHARFSREAQAALGEYLEEDDGTVFLHVGAHRWPLKA
jgi:hypothetical protein